ncbi:hypothetical protein PSACC_01512 [Paramicrosporidium saccamoebae]|uniref:BZIP domain-containing protein n=1 Tax=Paramicrosporidium saccamoebae TaxID=1246581 RepID=A0A2H9TLP6_9FUNG|nr:hypothetical protein PSACC_01512 [Paramicrosporidium saccamoebae]
MKSTDSTKPFSTLLTMTKLEYDLFGDLSYCAPATSSTDSSDCDPLLLNLPPPPPLEEPQGPPCDDKKRERAIKNRESAQASRERKRQYVSELEETRDTLKEESRNLRARVGALEYEKSSLMGELTVLKREFEQLKRLVMGGTEQAASFDTTSNPNAESCVHCAHQNHLGLSLPKGDETQLATRTDLSALRVWRHLTDGTIAPLTTPAHTPSASSHLLVSPGEAGLPDQPLTHVLRLRLRYRRPLTSSTRVTMGERKTLQTSRTFGSATGKSSLTRMQLKQKQQQQQKQKQSKQNRTKMISRQNLNLLWNQIISGCKKTRLSKGKKSSK